MTLLNVLPLTGLPVPNLTYEWTKDGPLPSPGTRLLVPLGRREEVGILWETGVSPPSGGISLKPVLEVLDPFPILPPGLFDILGFTSWFYRLPPGLVARSALPSHCLQPKSLPKKYQIDREKNGRDGSVPSGRTVELPLLTPDQDNAFSTWKASLTERSFSPWVLQGVTGSGKTRLYQEMAREVLGSGKQVLVLTPEIALVPPLVSAFSGIAGTVGTIHSRLTPAHRLSTWLSILRGSVPLVVGPRSSFFSPLTNLGLIIVDEEQDPAYQAYEGLSYNVRSLALKRAQLLGIPIVLGSATPLAESVHFGRTGRYRTLFLPTRVHGRPLPPISLSPPGKTDILPTDLVKEIGDNLARKEQTLILLNRRGYAPILRCVSCGHTLSCRQCSVHLVLHKKPERILVCHTCRDRYKAPVGCPHCGGNLLAEEGLATQKIEEWIKGTFSDARIERLDQDHPDRNPDSLEGFHKGEGDILIGTQMIAKGHDFRDVTLGIVLETDRMVSMPDYRAEERAFHLVLQLAGRVGRHRDGGRVRVVTQDPGLPFFQKLVRYDWEGFLDQTLDDRKSMGYPPFGRIGLLTVSERSETHLQDVLKTAGLETIKIPGTSVLGPTPAPVYRARQRFRYQYLIKSPTVEGIHAVLDNAFKILSQAKGVRLEWSVDPPDLLSS